MKHFLIFLKGLMMGASDIVPGVSGGTIAFITGIYERLIFGIKNLNVSFIFYYMKYIFSDLPKEKRVFKKKAREEFDKIDFSLFLPLGFGIALAFGIGSVLISHFLDNYPVFLYSLFFGLILGSIKILWRKIEQKSVIGIFYCAIAFLIVYFIVDINAIFFNHSLIMIFLSGFIAISAMLLPGISGALMLLILGQYRYMLEALKSFDLSVVSVFMTGAVLGLLTFARVMSYLLRKFHDYTLLFLIGLMLGALKIPFLNIFFVNSLNPLLGFNWTFFSVALVIFFAFLGVFIIFLINYLDKR